MALLCALLGLGAVIYFNSPPSFQALKGGSHEALIIEPEGKVILEVRNGESAASVGRRLLEAGIIRSRYFWDFLSYIDKRYLKTGTYQVTLPASQLEIREILVAGRQILRRVTIPEGVTLKKTARILANGGICDEAGFLAAAADREILNTYRIPGDTMEGYLYPDTYVFSPGYPPELVVKAMADTFFKRLAEIRKDAPDLNPEELHKRVILASIVEREYRLNEEAPIMAGVFYNRLNIGMALQSCATVEYVITEIQGKPHPEVLYTRDTEIMDPYNTYMRVGLPPGPISAPGAVALNAVFQPLSSDYLYFRLIDPAEGRHYFSKTLDAHIKAGTLYVKGPSL
ncbi:MAG: endolytic transglycosylase MltG [Spirochaetaceae bacterium]|jgi:UPF0755 protein|nr:endolytic transglycosylase MltG [Spirochaetaceae bacterium]